MDRAEWLAKIGHQVRAARHGRGLSVRALSELSGVSERFLVGVEGGKANPSIGTLFDVARALGCEVQALFGPLRPAARALERSVALVGLRGAGKSTLGHESAKHLGVHFVELDRRIFERAGMSPSELFDLSGLSHYRRLEREELDRVLAGPPCVIATAGSLVTEAATYERLRASATTIWLKAKPEDHYGRVLAQGDLRPMADRVDAMKELRSILRARKALYEKAHHTLDTSRLSIWAATAEIVRLAEAGVARDARA